MKTAEPDAGYGFSVSPRVRRGISLPCPVFCFENEVIMHPPPVYCARKSGKKYPSFQGANVLPLLVRFGWNAKLFEALFQFPNIFVNAIGAGLLQFVVIEAA
jgi:hypothetical protein